MDSTTLKENPELYPRLLRYVTPYWKTFALGLLCMAALAATEPVIPALLKPLLDGSFVDQDPAGRMVIPGFIIVLFLVRGILSFSSTLSSHWVANKVVLDLRNDMFNNFTTLPSGFFDNNNSGELLSKITYDVAQVAQAATRCISVLVKDSLTIVGLVAYMMFVAWKLSLVMFVVSPIVGFVVISVSRRMREMSRQVQQSMGSITQVAQETIDGQKAVKLYAGQDYERKRFTKAANKARQYTMKVVVASAANVPIIQLLMAFSLAIVVYLAAGQAAAGLLTIGEFVSFFTAVTLLLPPVKRLTGINEDLQRGLAAAASIFALIDEEPEKNSGTGRISRARGALAFEHVSMTYQHGHGAALTDVSFSVEPGETVALVGASGSGKSTLGSLIPRFYEPTGGRILLDGEDISQLRLESLRANISQVNQEIVLFNDSVRNNIAYGTLRDRSDGEIRKAAHAAHALEFIEALRDGFDTMIGEDGIRLSGGQRQRLAIARALLKDAPILILDEATSSLDTASERHIQAALDTLRRTRTCIVIAHRLSTVEGADRIIVMQQGQIVESGTHAELIRKRGAYAELHRLSFAD